MANTMDMSNLEALLLSLTKEVKAVARAVRRVQARLDDPDGEKAAQRSKRNGFNLPVMISKELGELLGMNYKEPVSRALVTTRVSEYVKENKMQSPEDGRVILAHSDEKFASVLAIPEDKKVTFTSLQTYLKGHYTKIEEDASASETPAEAPAPVPETPAAPAAAPAPIKKKAVVTKKRPTVRKPVAA